jgi:Amidohydrolase family
MASFLRALAPAALAAALLSPRLAAEGPAAVLRAFKAARIVTVEGPDVAPGTLLVRGDRVEAVLPAGGETPAGAIAVDLGDAVLVPGLVNPYSQVPAAAGYRDGRSSALSGGPGPPADVRSQRAADSIRPDAIGLRRLGQSGYAAVAVLPPGAGFLAGISAVVRPRSAPSREGVVVREAAFLSMSYGLGQPMREIAERELKKAAEAHRKSREEKAAPPKEEKKDGKKEEPAPAPPTDPLVQVYRGELPAVVRVDSPAALEHFFRVLDRLPEPFPFFLAAPPLEPEVVARVRARRPAIRGVILEPRLPAHAESSIYFNPALLFAEAGFDVALVPPTDDLAGHRQALFAAGELVKAGLPEAAALRALTIVPARLLGIADRFGSLAPGREASFLVLDGAPLSGTARVLAVYLQGEEVYREDPATGRATGEALR